MGAKKVDWTSPLAIAGYLAVAKLIIHVLTNSQYGYFRDELYYLALIEHLDWGFVDCAPLFPWIAKLTTLFLGTGLAAIRFLPAVAGALKVLLTGLLIREFGGKRFAVLLGCLCVIVAPAYLALDTVFTMNALEPLFWMGCVYCIVLVVNRNEPRYWLGFGVLAGLGVMNKHTAVFFLLGILVGLLFSQERKVMRTRWFWIAGLVALLIVLPNLVWQYQHDFATLEDVRNVKATGKNVAVSPLEFLWQQILIMNPLTLPVWMAGLWFFLSKRYRFLGFAYLSLLAVWMFMAGKHYYVVPAYPMLFAVGAVFWERIRMKRVKAGYLVVLLASGIVIAPLVLPILPPESLLAYQKLIRYEVPKTEVEHVGPLPQYFGDMFGWPEMVNKVTRVYSSLAPEERAKAAIFARNYGEAGAIDFFGPSRGLPKAISGHQNYFLWGPRNYTGEVIVVLQYRKEELVDACESIEETEVVDHPYSMAEEHYTILVCRGLVRPLKEVWPQQKNWN